MTKDTTPEITLLNTYSFLVKIKEIHFLLWWLATVYHSEMSNNFL